MGVRQVQLDEVGQRAVSVLQREIPRPAKVLRPHPAIVRSPITSQVSNHSGTGKKYLKTIYNCHACAGTLEKGDIDGDGELTVLDIDYIIAQSFST